MSSSDSSRSGGLVVAPHPAAADAGARALAAGGTAIDAAVATSFALATVDPAGCGLAGYGGFLVYAQPGRDPVRVDFNTWVPARVDPADLRIPGDGSELRDGGGAVAPPAVVAGLLTAHARFGVLALDELLAPAVALARDGFPIGRELARAFTDHWNRTGGGTPGFASLFYAGGRPLTLGETLVQPELARTIERIAAEGEAAFRSGELVDAICATVAADGGFLEPGDFAEDRIAIDAAEVGVFGSATLYGPSRELSGTGVLFPACGYVDPERLAANRSRLYVEELRSALARAWRERAEEAQAALLSGHTTHFCAADAEGGLVALTFTHGPRRFGSGLVAEGTGLVLNSGLNLFSPASGGPKAVTNMAPIVIETEGGLRHAVGSVGGPRIPGIVLSAVVDVAHYGLPMADAIAAPHLSVRPADGALEAEPELIEQLDVGEGALPIRTGIEFGPTSGIGGSLDGWQPGPDPRFDSGVARA
ncbi:MAG TPA: gamma-glutamyltransferase [Gaiellaceae bacterium]|nr:gamma-glutamyltransferase [Gaiellaceae bacterium]